MQETNLYTITVPIMAKHLRALDAILTKLSEHASTKASEWRPQAVHEEALLNDRLVFDQFDFKRQVQVACDNAKGGAARLAEIEIPTFEDNEKTIPELRERIQKTLSFIESIKPEQIIGKEGIKVTLPYWQDKHFTGFGYVTEYLMPNFFFHLTTAYSILRKNGIAIGKSDFMGSLPLND